MPTSTLFSIGHSTRSLDELLGLLGESAIAALVDVRRFPGSRRHPQFSQDALRDSLAGAGIAYFHEPDLGGRRNPLPGSPHVAWRVAAFRGYADHMASPAFLGALDRLLRRAAPTAPTASTPPTAPTVMMCAEAVPWRCHRRLIADAATVRGVEVRHILARGRVDLHELDPNARLEKTPPGSPPRLVYDGGVAAPLLPF